MISISERSRPAVQKLHVLQTLVNGQLYTYVEIRLARAWSHAYAHCSDSNAQVHLSFRFIRQSFTCVERHCGPGLMTWSNSLGFLLMILKVMENCSQGNKSEVTSAWRVQPSRLSRHTHSDKAETLSLQLQPLTFAHMASWKTRRYISGAVS